MVSSPNLSVFSNISPSIVENIKIQKNIPHSQSSKSSSASSIRNTVSSSVPIISELPTSPKSTNLKDETKCEKPAIEHEYFKPNTAEWTLQQVVVDDMPKVVGILCAWMLNCQS